MTQQYDRQMSLIVADASGNGIELAQLHVQFQVRQFIIETPNTLTARVYNLSSQTAQLINKEFTQVVLQAGYLGNYGRIFAGTIKQLRRGRENSTDTYLDIFAADADISHNWAVINRSLASGYTQEEVRQACIQSFGEIGQTTADPEVNGLQAFASPRGVVMFGMTRDTMRDLARTNKMTWSLDYNNLTMLESSAYKPGEAVVLSSTTGMIGIPQQTQDGITVTCLLNPNIGVGQEVHIDNASIGQYLKADTPIGLNFNSVDLPVSTSADGVYKVLHVDHVGDTRGNEWETQLICTTLTGPVQPRTGVALASPGFATPVQHTTSTMTDSSGNVMRDSSGNIMTTVN